MTNTKIYAEEILLDEEVEKVSGGTCDELHELVKAAAGNSKILQYCAGAAELASRYKVGCLGNIPLSYTMESILGELGVKAKISIGAFGTGGGENPNTYRNKISGATLSHAEGVERVRNYSNFILG